MKDGLINLMLYLTAAIDTGQNTSITLDDIKEEVKNGTIFNYLKTNIISSRSFDEKIFKKSEKEHLELHWKFHLIDQDFENRFGVNKEPLCVMLALVTISIQ